MAVVHQLPEEGEAEVANKGGERRGHGRFSSSSWSGRWEAARGGRWWRSAGMAKGGRRGRRLGLVGWLATSLGHEERRGAAGWADVGETGRISERKEKEKSI
jgi:hypothetical protein